MKLFVGKTLSLRIESAIAESHFATVQTMQKIQPESAADYIEVAGGYAAYAGAPDAALTQVVGAGLSEPLTTQALERCEEFYFSRQANCNIELSPYAGQDSLAVLNQRGYQMVEWSTILYRDLRTYSKYILPDNITITQTENAEKWARLSTQGFCEGETVPESLLSEFTCFAQIPNIKLFIATLNGQSAGAAATGRYNDVCDLGFTSTLLSMRGKGVQTALLQARLNHAVENGATLATVTTEPGSISQRNVERQDFLVAYTRTKFVRHL